MSMRTRMRVYSLMVAGLCVLCMCTMRSLRADTPPSIEHGAHVLILEGVIGGGNLAPLGQKLMQLVSDADRKQEDPPQVDLVINSPGGEIISGFVFLSIMDQARASGMHIRCFVPSLAASMAFQIFVHCDERYVLSKSFLLWHRARIFYAGPLTAVQSRNLAADLQTLDTVILSETEAALHIDTKLAEYHFEAETLHLGVALCDMAPKFCKSYDVVPGLFDAIYSDRSNTRNPQDSSYDRVISTPARGVEGDYIYIQPGTILPVSHTGGATHG